MNIRISEQSEFEVQLNKRLYTAGNPYDRMNAARAWFNQAMPRFEWYLEDEWNHVVEGQTWIEHHIRCLSTRNEFGPIGYDVYHNHQDGKGVWHLDDYQHSVVVLTDLTRLLPYLRANDPVQADPGQSTTGHLPAHGPVSATGANGPNNPSP